MKILIAGSVQGDGSYEEAELSLLLEQTLRAAGHTVDRFLLPYERNILSLPEQLLAYRLLEIHSCELLITIGYPACMLQHPNKVCYLFQLEPMLAEYWDSPYGVLANRQYSDLLFSVQNATRDALQEAKKLFCCSSLISQDLERSYGLASRTLLYPALLHCEERAAEQVDILCESCLLPWQRGDLLLQLFSAPEVRKTHKAKLFVPNAHLIYMEEMRRQIRQNGLADCVELVEGQRASKEDVSSAGAVFISDYQSRRISNIALEAVSHRKPILCMEDAGALAALLPKQDLIAEAALPSAFRHLSALRVAEWEMQSADMFAKELIDG